MDAVLKNAEQERPATAALPVEPEAISRQLLQVKEPLPLERVMPRQPESQYIAACQRIERAVHTWSYGYKQGDIEILRQFLLDVELVVTVNKLHINGLTPAELGNLEG